jgi:presenilin-like A22 family membrane protease
MKHTIQVTLILLAVFLSAQILGLVIISRSVDKETTATTGVLTYKELPFGVGRPEIEKPSLSWIYIVISVLLGTGLVFLIMKLGKVFLWKGWFFLSVAFCLTAAFAAFVNQWVALGLAVTLGLIKVLKPNILIHNFTELFIYGGLAAIFVPIMNIFSAFMMLIAISIYDAIAVWQSRHMVKLAKFQASSNLFAGLYFPYGNVKEAKEKTKPAVTDSNKSTNMEHTAILGGGDIGFPLIFAGVAMKEVGFGLALIIPTLVAVALALLLFKGEKGKFYPAMPFLSIGCAAGYVIAHFIAAML